MDLIKFLGYIYETVFKASAPRALIASLSLGLIAGLLLFAASKASYQKLIDEKQASGSPANGGVVSSGNGNANVGVNSGSVTVNNK